MRSRLERDGLFMVDFLEVWRCCGTIWGDGHGQCSRRDMNRSFKVCRNAVLML